MSKEKHSDPPSEATETESQIIEAAAEQGLSVDAYVKRRLSERESKLLALRSFMTETPDQQEGQDASFSLDENPEPPSPDEGGPRQPEPGREIN
jgi:hypothetical protein